MKYYELDKEEKKLERELVRDEWKPVKNLEAEKRRLQRIARNTLAKTRNINIRLTERDLFKLKAKAIREGIPYQTLAASLIHKATSE